MKVRLGALAVALVALFVACGTPDSGHIRVGASGTSSPSVPPPTITPGQQRHINEVSRGHGGTVGLKVEYAFTTRAAAEKLMTGSPSSDQIEVIAVVISGGKFFIPSGLEAMPPGSVLDFTLDPATDTVLDLGIVDTVPDLSPLGPTGSTTTG
jgi:hypothetical protein